MRLFARLKQNTLSTYDHAVGLVLGRIAIDGASTRTPTSGEAAGHSPVDRVTPGRIALRHDRQLQHPPAAP
ncbi:hypothetical protein ACF1BU_34110 [Streptomyces sp. NPDC014724]|uniref:hypothetical protein n=1 Tax=unclassified Streptomyces TaxID=2593676 RepID=UPI0036FE9FBC